MEREGSIASAFLRGRRVASSPTLVGLVISCGLLIDGIFNTHQPRLSWLEASAATGNRRGITGGMAGGIAGLPRAAAVARRTSIAVEELAFPSSPTLTLTTDDGHTADQERWATGRDADGGGQNRSWERGSEALLMTYSSGASYVRKPMQCARFGHRYSQSFRERPMSRKGCPGADCRSFTSRSLWRGVGTQEKENTRKSF